MKFENRRKNQKLSRVINSASQAFLKQEDVYPVFRREVIHELLSRQFMDFVVTLFEIHNVRSGKPFNLRNFLETVEKNIILRALQLSNGNVRRACILLQVKHTTLHAKLKKHRIRLKAFPFIDEYIG
jgi:transcriptional regulator of acetoin/glycerol metabolism